MGTCTHLPSPSFVWYNERIGCEDFSSVSFKYCMCTRVEHGHMDKCAEEKGREFLGVHFYSDVMATGDFPVTRKDWTPWSVP